jgi:peptide deformylase
MNMLNQNILENYELKGEELAITTYPDPVLSRKAQLVTEFNPQLETLCLNMLFTMYKAPGIGLAAPQVGISKRLFVSDVEYRLEEKTEADGRMTKFRTNFHPRIFINPEIITKDGSTIFKEGCLSLPTVYEDVKRSDNIIMRFQDLTGRVHEQNFTGLEAICLQHELDHLEGIVFIDRLSSLKKGFFKKKLYKLKGL